MTRGGHKSDREDGPARRCIATGQSVPASGLIRFGLGPDGQVVPDILGRLPGRGFWVSADRRALQTVIDRKAFARVARQQVSLPEDLIGMVDRMLADRVVSLIALARKAGEAIAGYEKVKGWLETGDAAVLLQASDGSGRGKSRLRPPEPVEKGQETYIEALTGAELGLAFGRDHVIHAALTEGGLTDRILDEAKRLAGLRSKDGKMPSGKA